MLVDIIESEIMQVAAMSWAQGFVAGVNRAAIADHRIYFDVSGKDGICYLQDVITFCRGNPEKRVIASGDWIIGNLKQMNWPE